MKASEFFVRKHDPKPGVCFVLMPFQEALTAVYEHGIKPQVEYMGMSAREQTRYIQPKEFSVIFGIRFKRLNLLLLIAQAKIRM